MNDASLRPERLILVPAVITLAVTLLRLIGELQGWSPALFNRNAGGGGALVGIAWLVPVFGAWFGWKLGKVGAFPGSLGRALGLVILALAILPLSGFLGAKLGHRREKPHDSRDLRGDLARGPGGGHRRLAQHSAGHFCCMASQPASR